MTIELDKQNTTQPNSGLSGLRYLSELAVGILLFCITLHTFFLAGLIVPVTVSGGSMAKTILGPRREVKCPACGIIIACGHERWPGSGSAYCSNCGTVDIDLDQGRDYPGEHAVVDRASLALNPPHRWEVIVFRCPDNPGQFCIKRVVGLPGEEIELKEGDVYVNGEIARKTLEQCREVAQPVYDLDHTFPATPHGTEFPRWFASQDESAWQFRYRKGYLYYPIDNSNPPKVIQWLEFSPAGNQGVTDDYDYNQSESRRLNSVADSMLRCEVALMDADAFYVRSDAGENRFFLSFSKSDARVRLERNGELVAEEFFAINDLVFNLEVIRFDHQLLVTKDQELVLSYTFDPQLNLPATPANSSIPWAIGMRGGEMTLYKMQVLRDIYYTVPTASRYSWGVGQSVTLADDEYFVLGDNSPISADSRIWNPPGISRKSLVGRLLGTW